MDEHTTLAYIRHKWAEAAEERRHAALVHSVRGQTGESRIGFRFLLLKWFGRYRRNFTSARLPSLIRRESNKSRSV
jgi:hypothetical protein